MKQIRYRIKCDWGVLESKPELELLKKYADVSRRCTIVIAVSFYLNIAFKIFPSLLCIFQYIFGSTSFTELILPFHIEYSMGNQIKYYFTLFNQYVIMIIVATVGIANYSMFIAVIQHACALFHIVEWRVIEKFKKDPHNIYYARTSSDLAEENEWIIDIIQFYNNAIEFLFQVLSFTFSATEAIARILYITGTLFVIYIYSYLAQKLIDHNVNVFLRFCQIPFYLLSLRTQKLLLCLLMNNMRVCSISLKGAIVVSHDLFATFMRKAFSFAMVLYSLQ
ncbi:hypothetical protein HZH68_017086 [Vespula germanica]|uniref:Odorant receptor n=1 Tax=Vespula germanica TaxID=30212 RepID=A0A834J0T6_VESGE|nr:hypothetical protein HZH68_017086 [Vespula germanica]